MLEDNPYLCNEFFVSQHVKEPIHQASNTLDLVFINNDTLLQSYNYTPTALPDH